MKRYQETNSILKNGMISSQRPVLNIITDKSYRLINKHDKKITTSNYRSQQRII